MGPNVRRSRLVRAPLFYALLTQTDIRNVPFMAFPFSFSRSGAAAGSPASRHLGMQFLALSLIAAEPAPVPKILDCEPSRKPDSQDAKDTERKKVPVLGQQPNPEPDGAEA